MIDALAAELSQTLVAKVQIMEVTIKLHMNKSDWACHGDRHDSLSQTVIKQLPVRKKWHDQLSFEICSPFSEICNSVT